MFGKLKEKLKNWFAKSKKDIEEKAEKNGNIGHEKLKRIIDLEINKKSNHDNIVIFNYKNDSIIFKWHQHEKKLNILYSEKLKTSLSKNRIEELTNELKKCLLDFIG